MERKKDFIEFGKIMIILSEAFGKSPSSKMVELYFQYLKDLSIEEIKEAADRVIKEQLVSVFPTIASIRKAIGKDEKEEAEFKALEAWNEACDFVRGFDPSYPTKHNDPFLNRVIELTFGGWYKFSETDPDAESFDRKHFIETYKSIDKREGELLLDEKSVLKELLETRKRIRELKPHDKDIF